MSLINDVLRDLDRQADRKPANSEPGQCRKSTRVRRVQWPWWLTLAAALGLALHLVWPETRLEPTTADLAEAGPMNSPAVDNAPNTPDSAGEQDDAPALSELPDLIALPKREPMINEPSPPLVPTRAVASLQIAQANPSATDSPVTETASTSQTGTMASETSESREPAQSLIRIERTDASTEPSPLLAAQRAMARGQEDLARHHLERQLENSPEDQESRLLLARIHQIAGREHAAARILDDGLALERSAPLMAARARLYLAADQAEKARNLLISDTNPYSQAIDYQLLLAAALHQIGENQEALEIYQRLSLSHPDHGQVWIGLGSSLEALQQRQAARQAYQRALQTGDARSAAFARNRLASLPQRGEDPQ